MLKIRRPGRGGWINLDNPGLREGGGLKIRDFGWPIRAAYTLESQALSDAGVHAGLRPGQYC